MAVLTVNDVNLFVAFCILESSISYFIWFVDCMVIQWYFKTSL